MSSPKIRILVVESDVSVRKTVSWLLVKEGYEVSSANDGFDALLHLQKEVPDLLLSDLNMPQMSGFELLSVVRRRFPQVLVVAMSGAYQSATVPDGVLADAFYPKGQESAQDLVSIIADLLGRAPVERNPESAPVWIPRNGKDREGVPFVVLSCTQCLRSFPFSVSDEPSGKVQSTPCIYCPHEIAYIIDFSRSVNSPEKRAAWKAAFLKTSQRNAA
jgi:CheY-like chemotaxis protein